MSAAAVSPCPELCPGTPEVVLRPLEPDQPHVLLEVFAGLGARSRERRFLAPKHHLTGSDLRQLTAVDHVHHEALVAVSTRDERPVGIARFVRDEEDPEAADVAVTVVDAWQGQGIGTILAAGLVERAREVGITRFTAMMLPDNEPAVRLMHRTAGEVERVALDPTAAEFVIRLVPSRSRRPRRRLLKGV